MPNARRTWWGRAAPTPLAPEPSDVEHPDGPRGARPRPDRRGPATRWPLVVGPRRGAPGDDVYVVSVIVALIARPLVGVALAGVGAVFLLFRQVDLDATTVLTVYLLLLTLIPASYVVPALGAAGTPAGIIALGVGYWWVLERTAPRSGGTRVPGPTGFQPFRAAVLFYVLTAASAFVVAFSRPLSSVEANGAARAMMGVAGTAGVALLAADGLRSRSRFDVLVNRVLNLGVVMSLVGVLAVLHRLRPGCELAAARALRQPGARLGGRAVGGEPRRQHDPAPDRVRRRRRDPVARSRCTARCTHPANDGRGDGSASACSASPCRCRSRGPPW